MCYWPFVIHTGTTLCIFLLCGVIVSTGIKQSVGTTVTVKIRMFIILLANYFTIPSHVAKCLHDEAFNWGYWINGIAD